MLKNVVLPAPFGPMIETIERGATEKDTSLTATSPPKALLTRSVASSAPSDSVAEAPRSAGTGWASLMRAPRTRTRRDSR